MQVKLNAHVKTDGDTYGSNVDLHLTYDDNEDKIELEFYHNRLIKLSLDSQDLARVINFLARSKND